MQKENAIKKEILHHFRFNPNINLYPIKNTGTARIGANGEQYYTRGLIHRGIADLIGTIAPDGRFLAIECKTPDGLARFNRERSQYNSTAWCESDWGEQIIKAGGIYIIAVSGQDAENQLNEMLKGK